MVWVALCSLFLFVLTLGIGLFFVWLPLGILGLWFVYRIARGWLALRDNPADVRAAVLSVDTSNPVKRVTIILRERLGAQALSRIGT